MSEKDMSHAMDYVYVKIKGYQDLPIIHLSTMEEFKKILEQTITKTVLVRSYEPSSSDNKIIGGSEFIGILDRIAYSITGSGYQTLEDYVGSSALGFDGKSSKFRIRDKHLEESSYGTRISDGYLFYHVRNLGYKDYSEFEKSFDGGFYQEDVPVKEFRDAVSKGFTEYDDYIDFKDSSFEDVKEYVEAKKLGIDDLRLYRTYLDLKGLARKTHLKGLRQLLAYMYLGTTDEKKVSMDKIERFAGDMSQPFTRHSRDSDLFDSANEGHGNVELGADLCTSGAYHEFGTFDSEKGYFYKFIGVPLFIDGSNVAYNNQDKSKGAKPSARFIRLVVEEARKLGFTDIRLYHDANLEYIVTDAGELETLKKEVRIEKVPARTIADEFIIQLAKKHGGFIVSFDQFRDHLEKHPEDQDFIDTHRLAFMIDDDGQFFFSNRDQVNNSPSAGNSSLSKLRKDIEYLNSEEYVNEKSARRSHRRYNRGI